MDLEDDNSQLTEINTKIGRIKFNRNIYAFCTGMWILNMGADVTTIIINPIGINILATGLHTLAGGLCGLLWYLDQKKLDILRAEQQELKIEEIIQKRLKNK